MELEARKQAETAKKTFMRKYHAFNRLHKNTKINEKKHCVPNARVVHCV